MKPLLHDEAGEGLAHARAAAECALARAPCVAAMRALVCHLGLRDRADACRLLAHAVHGFPHLADVRNALSLAHLRPASEGVTELQAEAAWRHRRQRRGRRRRSRRGLRSGLRRGLRRGRRRGSRRGLRCGLLRWRRCRSGRGLRRRRRRWRRRALRRRRWRRLRRGRRSSRWCGPRRRTRSRLRRWLWRCRCRHWRGRRCGRGTRLRPRRAAATNAARIRSGNSCEIPTGRGPVSDGLRVEHLAILAKLKGGIKVTT
mmetsp:Transcript_77635/g.215080  ORF Transcript_77635/g.215080 Transcript_77635/m.215080 type:complete len:258 (+) Transcript_77635:139-912(+)